MKLVGLLHGVLELTFWYLTLLESTLPYNFYHLASCISVETDILTWSSSNLTFSIEAAVVIPLDNLLIQRGSKLYWFLIFLYVKVTFFEEFIIADKVKWIYASITIDCKVVQGFDASYCRVSSGIRLVFWWGSMHHIYIFDILEQCNQRTMERVRELLKSHVLWSPSHCSCSWSSIDVTAKVKHFICLPSSPNLIGKVRYPTFCHELKQSILASHCNSVIAKWYSSRLDDLRTDWCETQASDFITLSHSHYNMTFSQCGILPIPT
jgi:hypothetical protein